MAFNSPEIHIGYSPTFLIIIMIINTTSTLSKNKHINDLLIGTLSNMIKETSFI